MSSVARGRFGEDSHGLRPGGWRLGGVVPVSKVPSRVVLARRSFCGSEADGRVPLPGSVPVQVVVGGNGDASLFGCWVLPGLGPCLHTGYVLGCPSKCIGGNSDEVDLRLTERQPGFCRATGGPRRGGLCRPSCDAIPSELPCRRPCCAETHTHTSVGHLTWRGWRPDVPCSCLVRYSEVCCRALPAGGLPP